MPFANLKTLMLTGLLLLLSVIVSAETLTLEQCIDLALKNHPDVIRARGSVKTARADVLSAFGQFLPRVSASAQVYQTEGSIVIDGIVIAPSKITKNYTIGASANLTLFNGGQNIFNYLTAKANKAYFDYAAEQTENNLILSVKLFYFANLASEKLVEIRKEAVKRGEEQFKLASSKFEVGSASKSDVLKAKVQYGKDKLDLINAENGFKKALADLAYLIGLEINSDIKISSSFNSRKYDGTETDALKFGTAHFPGLLAADKSLVAARNNVRSAKGGFLPTISVFIGRNYQNQFWREVKKFDEKDGRWAVGTTLSIPIFQNFSNARNLSRAKVSFNNARSDYYYSKNKLALEIKKAYLDMASAREQLNVSAENEEAAAEDMSLVQEKYNLGAATILELLDAQVSLITAQNDNIQSDFDYNLAVAKLENAMVVRRCYSKGGGSIMNFRKNKKLLMILGGVVVAAIIVGNIVSSGEKTTKVKTELVEIIDITEEVSASGYVQPQT